MNRIRKYAKILYLFLVEKESLMKFSLAKEHLHHFHQQGYVEFEGILSREKLEIIRGAIRKGAFDSPEQHFGKQHDLWRRFPELKNILFHREPASIVASLNRVKPLRIGYDQLIPLGFQHKKPLTLKEMSSFQGVAGGYFLCLQDCPGTEIIQPLSEDPEKKIAAPFSTVAGNMVFIQPDVALDFSAMPCDHLLVCFAGEKALYCFNENDPHTHDFKRLGYVFGDKLLESELPTVLRELNI